MIRPLTNVDQVQFDALVDVYMHTNCWRIRLWQPHATNIYQVTHSCLPSYQLKAHCSCADRWMQIRASKEQCSAVLQEEKERGKREVDGRAATHNGCVENCI